MIAVVFLVISSASSNMVMIDAEHHVGIHLDEAAIAESQAKRSSPDFFASASTVLSLRPRLSTVSIMPGIEARAPERTETSSGLAASPNDGEVACRSGNSRRRPRW
jgi:hypothetical protein